uniref:Uncharacterized protein n=1 Tax=Marmota marmota marmota TaxID=9994 RepID=A0A8C6ESC2_MARMA
MKRQPTEWEIFATCSSDRAVLASVCALEAQVVLVYCILNLKRKMGCKTKILKLVEGLGMCLSG